MPHFTGYNSLLSLEMPLSEAVYYALILRELLPKRDAYATHCRKLMEENACGLGDIHAEYYYIGMHADLRKMNGLVERYARCDEAASVRDVMKEYCG